MMVQGKQRNTESAQCQENFAEQKKKKKLLSLSAVTIIKPQSK